MPSLLCESFHESCGFSHLSSSHLTLRTSCHTLCTKIVSPLCGSLIFLEVNWSWEVLCAPLVYLQPEFYYSLVLLQVTLLWEAFATLCALKLFVSCVVPSCLFNSPDPTTWVGKQYTSDILLLTLFLRRAARSAFYFIQHKSGYDPDMKRKMGNPAPLCSGYWSKDSKKL